VTQLSDRRRFLSLVTGLTAVFGGCTDASRGADSTPTPSGPPTFTGDPAGLLLDAESLPSGQRWEELGTDRPEENTYSVTYQVFENGSRSHQATLELARRQTADGAVFDHDKLVELYRSEKDATTADHPYGDVATVATFGDEAHGIVAYRNASVHFSFYEDGPVDRLERLLELQTEKLARLAP